MTRFSATVSPLAVFSALLIAAPSWAQAGGTELASADSGGRDDIVVTGTRRAERSVVDSSAPIDVVDTRELSGTPSPDLNDKLMQLIPSFNVQRLPGIDGASFVRPASLRSLSADQTLVLVNGKRRHRSAYIDITPQRGAQAVDLSQIPAIALRRVEVLRDGASAQYGSDAIAGVINLLLEDRPGFSASAQTGQFYEGDGFSTQVAARAGIKVAQDGALVVSGEFSHADATDRSPAPQRIGQPENRNYRLFYNFDLGLGDALRFYSFGNYGHSWGEVDFSQRFLKGQLRIPHFASTTDDFSSVAGLKGNAGDLSWDLSGRYGRNKVHYRIYNTANLSLGDASPTDFDPGDQIQTEYGANLDLNYLLDVGLAEPLNIAFGGELQRQRFELKAGDLASYVTGPVPDVAPGSNGYPGVTPAQAGRWSLNSRALYLDVDADLTERLNLSAAVRYEHYSTFGSTTNFKLSGRYGVTDFLNLRGTVSTGFRAPTPGQSNITSTQQAPDVSQPGPPYPITTRALIPPDSPVALAFGGSALRPEKSRNYSLGLVLHPGTRFTLTADIYRIDIRDRIGLLPSTKVTPSERASLIASGIPSAANLDEYRFFINGLKTRTQGIDVVASYAVPLETGSLKLTAAYNHNETKIKKADPRFTQLETYQFYEHHLPQDTLIATANLNVGRVGLFARARHYGPWVDAVFSTPIAAFNQKVGSETFVDVSATYRITENISLTAGVDNLFDGYPDKTQGILPTIGYIYPIFRPYEADGGRYFARLDVNF